MAENGVISTPGANVNAIKKEWSVYEDGALAVKLQEEENTCHYSGNINRRRTVRSDIKTAKSAADEEALKAFQEEHNIVEKNREIEIEDAKAAQELLQEMMEEEKRKLRERKRLENEERDRIAANELRYQMEQQQRQKMSQKKSLEETDAELALRLQAHEENKRRILKQRSADHEVESEHLARNMARQERFRSLQEHGRGGAYAEAESDYMIPSVARLTVGTDDMMVALPSRGRHRGPHGPQTTYLDTFKKDSDDETDVIAKIQDDAELARRLQRDEINRSVAPSQMTEEKRKQLIYDQKIAIKMQHEEVMFSKKKTYDEYMGKVRDEIAEAEPMVYVSKNNKVAVPAEAKYSDRVNLTDYTAAEGAMLRRTSGSEPPGEGNIVTSLDPTYRRRDSGNVVLLKNRPIAEEQRQDPEPAAVDVVPGTRRKDSKGSKELKKKGSIFNKLKKK